MILMAFRHGLRASELCSLRWDQVDLGHGRLHVHRLKNGMPSVHPLTGTELRALRRLQREQEPGRYVFTSERGAPMTAVAFRRMLIRLGQTAPRPKACALTRIGCLATRAVASAGPTPGSLSRRLLNSLDRCEK